ncbi:programmed cell death protein 1 isoform X1 [Passer domesticus]|uniref:programmed cell death protein 1 isoform X1 n=1 Tax=Passer domesticus TaxID=48849 RepID=UPI0030FE717C
MAPGASKKSWSSVEVALVDLCVILLCCGPMLTCCRHVTIFPEVLTLPEGDKATFFCNISMENDSGSEYILNWYKETNHSQAQKIAEISRNKPMTVTEKYQLINHTSVFEIEILNLHQNDSGSYYCGLITFYDPDKVMESNQSQLIVTAAPQVNATDEPEMEEGSPSEDIKAMLLGILLLAGVIVLLIFGYLTFTYRKGDVQKPPSENMPVVSFPPLSPCCAAGEHRGIAGLRRVLGLPLSALHKHLTSSLLLPSLLLSSLLLLDLFCTATTAFLHLQQHSLITKSK